MIRLSHRQWSSLHKLSLQIQDVANENELIQRVVHYIPKAIGVNYSVWHELDKKNPAKNKSVHMPEEYLSAFQSVEDQFTPNLHTHPIIFGLGIGRDLVFPKDRVYGMADFASGNEIKETPIMKNFYSHLEAKDNTCIQLIGAEESHVFLCFNTMSEFTPEQKYSLQVLREHISIVVNRFRRDEERATHSQLSLPSLDYNNLTSREKETLPYLLQGKSNVEMSIIFNISKRTVEKHVASIVLKSGVENRKVLISEARLGGGQIG